jgi:hypothetical protein
MPVSSPSCRRQVALHLVLFCLAFVQATGATSAPTQDEIVQLPAFIVEAAGIKKPAPHWYHAELPGMEILSCLSERETKAVLAEMSDQMRLYAWTLPIELRPSAAGPLVVILDDRGLTNVRLVLKSLPGSPASRTRRTIAGGFVHWDFGAIYYQSARASPAASAFLVSAAAMMNMQRNAGWSHIALIWGVATDNVAATPDGVVIQQPESALKANKLPLPPLAELFDPPQPEPNSARSVASSREMNTWFGRWALFAEEGRHQEDWWRFVRESTPRPEMNDAVAERFFHASLSKLEASVVQFRKSNQSKRRVPLKLPHLIATPTTTLATHAPVRDATETEIARALTQWTLLAWRTNPDLRVPLRDAARRLLAGPPRKAGEESSLTALRGLVELMDENRAEGWRLLESVADSPNLTPAARLELARLRHADAIAQAGAPPAKFTAAQVDGIVGPLAPFLISPPGKPEVLSLIASAWQRAPESPLRDDVVRLVAGARLFPRETELLLETANLCMALGLVAEAKELAALGLAASKTEASRQSFQSLQGRIRSTFP